MSALELFLVANAFLLGVVVTLAIQYFSAHRNSKKMQPKVAASALPPAVRERITKQAETNLQGIVNRSSLQLQHDLGATGSQLNKLLEKFGSEVLDDEMRLFRANVADIRAATQGTLSGAQDQIATQQAAIMESLATRQAELEQKLASRQTELEADLEQNFQAQKDDLAQRLNEKMNDAVLAFLLETLGHQVDLGAQADYIIATLEENKSELVGSVTGQAASSQPESKP